MLPKSPEWAAPITGVPARTIRALADMGLQAPHRHLQRRPGHPRPLLHRARPPAGAPSGHAGLGKPGVNQAKMIEVVSAPPREPGRPHALGPVQHRHRLPRRRPAGRRAPSPASPRRWSPSSSWRARAPGTATATACAAAGRPVHRVQVSGRHSVGGMVSGPTPPPGSPAGTTVTTSSGRSSIPNRVHHVRASLDRERRPVRRHSCSGQHQARGGRHGRLFSGQMDMLSSRAAWSRWARASATTRWSASSPIEGLPQDTRAA